MSLTLKRACPFTLTIQCTMDPDPYSTQMYPDSTTTSAWTPISPGTILEDPFSHQAAILPNTTRSSSPPKRPRNAKNLSLNVPAGAAGTKNSTNNSFPTSAPASPFRSPRLPTRRPSNLTINVHSLHRHPSTPELHKVGTPIVMSPAPIASSAKQFPGLNVDVNHNSERPRTRHTDPTITTASYFDENVEREKAYPDGPRLILEPNIWLYAEPDLQLAKTYDLVVNVAREVTNPFIVNETTTSTTTLDSTDPSKLSPESDQETTPSPFSSFSSARSTSSPYASSTVSSGISISPKTNKAPSPTSPTSYHYSNVEYMHIPWDHNSSLTQELPGIVDHILERSAQGKKVLVHCQVSIISNDILIIVWCITLSDTRHRPSHEKTRYGHPRSIRLRQIPLAVDRT